MKKILFPYVIVPALVLGLLTIVRAMLEVQMPDSALTKAVSVNVLSLVWTLCVPMVMLRKGLSLVQMLIAGVVFFVLHRLFIGTVYAIAWSNQWTVAGTGDPVRYVAQTRAGTPTISVFLGTTFAPVGFGTALLLVIWAVTWAIGFRGKRPFARAAMADRENA